ncbi:MAG: glycosyltransferase family 1 protein [Anaerolineales bacterium]
MLIGVDASRALTAERTGTEHYSLELISALLALGSAHRFRLYTPQAPPATLAAAWSRAEWRIIPFPRLWTHVRLSLEMLLDPPDVLFVPAHVLPLVHRGRGVVTIHDLGYLHFPQAHPRQQRLYLDWSTRWSARVARQVVVDSLATQQDLVTHYGTDPRKVRVAYPAGRDLCALVDAAADAERLARFGLHSGYILAVGTIQPRKNLLVLLEAFAALLRADRLPAEARLVLAGRAGWLSDETLARAQADDLREHVTITGYVTDAELAALYRGAMALAFPSLYEGFGLPVLEAMQCGVPVICSTSSSLPEIAGSGADAAALLVAPDDLPGWQTALDRVYHEPALRESLRARGRERAMAFSWERCARAVLAAIEEAAPK